MPGLVLSLALAPAHAQSEWRTQVQVSVGSGTSTQFAFDGGLNVPSSYQILSNLTETATAEAASELSSAGYLPTLRARALAAPTRAQAVAWGVQAYTNTSGAPLDTTLVLQLDANITGNNDVEGRVYLFQDENFEFSIDPGTILFESSSQLWPGFETYANNLGPTGFDVVINNTPGPVSETRQFPFTVAAGDSFYVWARLVATADQAGEADAFSTMTASLTNTVGLTPIGGGPAGVPAGRIPSTGAAPLLVEPAAAGEITLTWSNSCAAGDDDYAIYEGALGLFTSHVPLTCTTGGATSATFLPAGASSYYLVVPNNPGHEGSYGLDSLGAERAASAASCRPQLLDVCP